jgi:mannose-6-phosphate isomerase-like protein (cupin superfamily)
MRNPFTHKQLNEVKNSAPEFGFGDDIMEARFAKDDLDAEQTGFSFHRIRPGKRQPFGHVHEEAEEVYVVVRGGGLLKLDDEIIEVERLDAIRVSPEVTRLRSGRRGARGDRFRPAPRRRRQGRPRLVERLSSRG